jgi:hypothetical protein
MPTKSGYGDEGTDASIVAEVERRMKETFAPGRSITVVDAISIIGNISPNEDWIRDWTERLTDLADSKREMGWSTLAAFKSEGLQEYAMLKDSGKASIKMAALYALFNPDSGSMNYWAYNELWYFRHLTRPGEFMLCTGGYGSGKTAIAIRSAQVLWRAKEEQRRYKRDSVLFQTRRELKRADKAREEAADEDEEDEEDKKRAASKDPSDQLPVDLYSAKGIRFVTNISVPPTDDDPEIAEIAKAFRVANRLSDIISFTLQNALEGYYTGIILDELGFAFNKKRSMSTHNFAIERVFKFIRKYIAYLVVITQDEQGDIPDALTRACRTKIEKLGPKKAIFEIRGSFSAQRVRNIPKPILKFRSRAFATVVTDTDPGALVDHVTMIEEQSKIAGKPWTDLDMYRHAIDWLSRPENRLSEEELKQGKHGLFRNQARYWLTLTNDATGATYTVDEVCERIPYIDREVVEDAQKELILEARKKRERTGKKAEESPPILVA